MKPVISVVIPTYGRDSVLIDTLERLLEQSDHGGELVVVDQTPAHAADVAKRLRDWDSDGAIRWLRLEEPSVTRAMNVGLLAARSDIVLFLDDDIVPGDTLLHAHLEAHAAHTDAWSVAGQVLQPGESPGGPSRGGRGSPLNRDLDFSFRSDRGCYIENLMAGNASVNRSHAMRIGGFDERFGPPVAFRFETEFAKRLVRAGGKIWFEPSASIRHLRAPSGGTRSTGNHLGSASGVHGVGDYYYALRCGRGLSRIAYMARRPFREVRTRYHLRRPQMIPVKLLGESRAIGMALRLIRERPAYCGAAQSATESAAPGDA